VILGETAPLLSTPDTWGAFLNGSRGFLDGYLFFYDGRTSGEVRATAADVWYAAAIEQFLSLRGSLV
jgi:hypothetical protein